MIKAAIDYDPKEAIGLDGALQKLAHAAYGPWLLGLSAAGLVCYGGSASSTPVSATSPPASGTAGAVPEATLRLGRLPARLRGLRR